MPPRRRNQPRRPVIQHDRNATVDQQHLLAMIEDLRRQVEALTQRNAQYHLSSQDGVESEEEDYHGEDVNPFYVNNAPRPAAIERRWNGGFKVDIPEFSGDLNGEGFVDWLSTVERVFDLKDVLEDKKVKVVAVKLRGRASAWWDQLIMTRQRQGKPKITNWEKMRKKMRETFLPYNYTQLVYQRLQNYHQGGRKVDEYTEEFYELVLRNELNESEEQKVARYIEGLRINLQDILNQQDIWSVSQAYQRAKAAEIQQARGSNRVGNNQSSSNRAVASRAQL